MPISSRQKGAAFETKICKKLEELTGESWERTPGSGAYATRTGNLKFAGDVMCTSKPSKYVFELKKYKEADIENLLVRKGNVWKWFEQLVKEKKHRPGILVFMKNYGRTIVVVETPKDMPSTFRWGKWLIGEWDKVMPEILEGR